MATSTIDLPTTTGQSSTNVKYGVRINPNEELTEVSGVVDSGSSGFDTAYILDASESVIASKDVSSKSSGDTISITGLSLTAGNDYYFVLDASGGIWTYGSAGAGFPYTSAGFDVTAGYDDGDNGSTRFIWTSVTVTYTETTAPSTPQNLTASVSNGDDIDLNWDAVNWGGEQGHYDVYRGTSSGSLSQIAQVSAGTTSYTDTGLGDGDEYHYEVDATNSAGTSGRSNQASATTVLPAPSGLTATASADDISLSWTDNADNEDGYRLFRRPTDGSYSEIADLSAGATSYTDTGLTDGEQYEFYVEAYTEHTTAQSGTDTATTALPAPTIDSLDTATAGEIVMDWTDNSDHSDGFEILRSTDGSAYTQIDSVGGSTTSYTDTGLADGERYWYQIRVTTEHASSTSAASDAISKLPAPSSLTVQASGQTIDLSWADNSDNEDEFRIRRGTASGSLSQVDTVAADATSYSDTGLTEGETYYYEVEAATEHTTATSGEASATTDLTAPTNVSSTLL